MRPLQLFNERKNLYQGAVNRGSTLTQIVMFWETAQSNISFETTHTHTHTHTQTHKSYPEYILLPDETMQAQYTGITFL